MAAAKALLTRPPGSRSGGSSARHAAGEAAGYL